RSSATRPTCWANGPAMWSRRSMDWSRSFAAYHRRGRAPRWRPYCRSSRHHSHGRRRRREDGGAKHHETFWPVTSAPVISGRYSVISASALWRPFAGPFRRNVSARLARGLFWRAEGFVASGRGKYRPAKCGKHLSELDHFLRKWLPHVVRHNAEVAGELELIVDLGGRFDADVHVASELESRCGSAAF